MSRFVRPATCTLDLANGDHLIVRARLTAGETRGQYARMYVQLADGNFSRNPLMSGMGIILAYLLDWDLKDDDGRPVAIRDLSPEDLQRVIDSLDFESFDEIKTAIEGHESRMNAERAAEKKTRAGVTP